MCLVPENTNILTFQEQQETLDDERIGDNQHAGSHGESNDGQLIDENEEEVVDFNDVRKSSTKRPRKTNAPKLSMKQGVESEENEILKQTVRELQKVGSRVKNDTTADDIIGHYVASELKCVKDEYIKKLLKHKIQNILCECQVPMHHNSGYFSSRSADRHSVNLSRV